MIIKAQNEKLYDIYTVSTKENKVCCQDNADRRRKVILGEYQNDSRAYEVFNEIMNCIIGYYEMPMH